MSTPPQKHDVLWFPDGNVVLATDSLLFRVHKGVISLHSTVLKDMFDLPTYSSLQAGQTNTSAVGEERSDGGVTRPELYEGLPMVWLSDKGEELAHLLRAVYERGHYKCEDNDTPLEMILALLPLSAKYDVASVRSDVIKQLSLHYPTKLDVYEFLESINGGKPMLFGRPRRECHYPLLKATAITSQSEADIQAILPALYYACSCASIDKLYGIETLSLPPPVLHKLFTGERQFAHEFHVNLCAAIDSVSPPEGCPFNSSTEECNTTRRSPQTSKMTNFFTFSVLSRIKNARVVLDTFFEKRCDKCRTRMTLALENTRTHLWDIIPSMFSFESWEAVRAAK